MTTQVSAAQSATQRIIRRLEAGKENHVPFAARDMATLRRAAGREPGECPEAFGIITSAVDPEYQGDGWVSNVERAAFVAVTLWALHSQSQPTPMHRGSTPERKAINIGQAVRQLACQESPGALEDHTIMKRWRYLIAADTVDMFAARARAIVSRLRGAGIGFDYTDLAAALVHWESYPEHRRRVLISWSRDFPSHSNSN